MNSWIIRSLVFLALSPLSVLAGDGDLDPTFAGNGKAIVGFTSGGNTIDAFGLAVAVQSDGKIVVAGNTVATDKNSALARLNADGSLDTTFGTGGRTGGFFIKQAGTDDYANGLAIQSDGKIVVFGEFDNVAYVVRLLPSGARDPAFPVTFYPSNAGPTTITKFTAGAITASGQIFASGRYDDGTGSGPTMLNVLFDTSGNVVFSQDITNVFSIEKNAVAIQPDGKALVVATGGDCKIVRDNVGATLSLDSGFATNGIGTFNWNLGSGSLDFCTALALQHDGKILMGGEVVQSDSRVVATVLRLMPDGTLDSPFGKKTFVFASSDVGNANVTTGILVQNDQSIVLTGIAGTSDPDHGPEDFAAMRLLPDGSLDTTFTATTAGSSLGKVVFGFETNGSGRLDQCNASVLQGNEIVMVGYRETSNASQFDQFAVARLQNDKIFANGFEP